MLKNIFADGENPEIKRNFYQLRRSEDENFQNKEAENADSLKKSYEALCRGLNIRNVSFNTTSFSIWKWLQIKWWGWMVVWRSDFI